MPSNGEKKTPKVLSILQIANPMEMVLKKNNLDAFQDTKFKRPIINMFKEFKDFKGKEKKTCEWTWEDRNKLIKGQETSAAEGTKKSNPESEKKTQEREAMKKPQRNEDGKESTSWSNKGSVERFNMWKKGQGLTTR